MSYGNIREISEATHVEVPIAKIIVKENAWPIDPFTSPFGYGSNFGAYSAIPSLPLDRVQRAKANEHGFRSNNDIDTLIFLLGLVVEEQKSNLRLDFTNPQLTNPGYQEAEAHTIFSQAVYEAGRKILSDPYIRLADTLNRYINQYVPPHALIATFLFIGNHFDNKSSSWSGFMDARANLHELTGQRDNPQYPHERLGLLQSSLTKQSIANNLAFVTNGRLNDFGAQKFARIADLFPPR